MKCTFCGDTIKEGTGLMYVKTDGKILYFDKKKCEKNLLQLRRKPVKARWTQAHHKQKKGAQ